MDIQNLQRQMQAIIDDNPRPRMGFEEVVLLSEIERCNKACIDYMNNFDLPRVYGLDVVLYSKPDCTHCNDFKQWLDTHSVPYTLRLCGVDVTQAWLSDTFLCGKLYPVVTICGVWYPDIGKAKKRILEGI